MVKMRACRRNQKERLGARSKTRGEDTLSERPYPTKWDGLRSGQVLDFLKSGNGSMQELRGLSPQEPVEEVISLIIRYHESREVFYGDHENGLHAQFGVIKHFHAGNAFLS